MEDNGHIYKTYVEDICNKHLFVIYPTYEGLPVIPSHSAFRELEKYGLMLDDVKEILAEGYDCQRGRRKKGTIERCVREGQKTLKVVVVKSVNCTLDTECWVLTHVGMF